MLGGFGVGSANSTPWLVWVGKVHTRVGVGEKSRYSPVPYVGNMFGDTLTVGQRRGVKGSHVQVEKGRSHPYNEQRLQRRNIGVGFKALTPFEWHGGIAP